MRLGLSRRADAPRRYRITRWAGAAIATATARVLLVSAVPAAAAPTAAPGVPVLNWQPCTSPAAAGFRCATARVPQDQQPFGLAGGP